MAATTRNAKDLNYRSVAASTGRQRRFWSSLGPYLFIAPFMISFLILFVGPALYSLVLSFYRYRGFGTARWVGLTNYRRLLAYHQFWSSWVNTIVYWLGSAAVTIVLAFLLAVLVYFSSIRGKNIYKPVFFLPNVMAAVAAALVFQTIFAPQSGVLNSLLGVHLAWDQDPMLGKLAVIAVLTWHGIGWYFVIFLAGLTTINPELYDAAKVDGARSWQTLWSITLPLMKRTFLFAVVIISIYSLRMFAEPNLIFANSSTPGLAPPAFQPIMNQLYENMTSAEFGTAAAMAWLIFIPIVIVAAVQFRLLSGDVEETVT